MSPDQLEALGTGEAEGLGQDRDRVPGVLGLGQHHSGELARGEHPEPRPAPTAGRQCPRLIVRLAQGPAQPGLLTLAGVLHLAEEVDEQEPDVPPRRPGPELPHLVLVALRRRLAEVAQGVPEGRADEQAVLAAQSVGRDAPVPPSEGPGPRMLEQRLVAEADPQAALMPREEALRLQVENDLLLAFEAGERHP